MKYVVIVENEYTKQAMLGKLNYSGERYAIVARGNYSDIKELASLLNVEPTA